MLTFIHSFPSYTSATAPAASAVSSGTIIRMTDIGVGANGSLWESNGTYWVPAESNPIVLARSSVQVTDAASGSDLIYAKLTLPPRVWATNTAIRLRAGFSSTSSVNTKTYRYQISSTSSAIGGTVTGGTILAAMTAQSSTASQSIGAVISNRNSISTQSGFYIESRSPGTISVGTTTSAIDTSVATTYIYLTALKATAGETVTLESFVAELM